MKTPITLTAVAAALALGLTACGSDNTVTPAPFVAASSPAAPAPVPDPAPVVPSPTKAVPKMYGDFGDTITFPGGVAVKASVPRVVDVNEYAYGAIDGKALIVELSVTNNGAEPVDALLMGYPQFTYGAAGNTAGFVTDLEAGIGSTSFSTILPGETQTAVLGYAVPADSYGDVRMEVEGPSYTDKPAIFKGGAR